MFPHYYDSLLRGRPQPDEDEEDERERPSSSLGVFHWFMALFVVSILLGAWFGLGTIAIKTIEFFFPNIM